MAKKEKSNSSSWLTKKYQLIIRNEADFLEKRTISYNYARAIMLFAFVFTINAIIGYFMIRYVDKLLSNKKDIKQLGQEVVKLAKKKEELEKQVGQLMLYETNIKELMGVLNDTSEVR